MSTNIYLYFQECHLRLTVKRVRCSSRSSETKKVCEYSGRRHL